MTTIGEKHSQQKKRKFIDRETEISIFNRQLEINNLDFNILFLHGIGGVGKSTLLDEFEQLCNNKKIDYARNNIAEVQDIVKILRKIRLKADSRKLFSPFKKFDYHVEHYLELIGKLESQGAFDGLAKLAARLGSAADPTGILGEIPNEKIVGSVKSLRAYLSKPEIDFYLNADKFLTETFHVSLNKSFKFRFVIFIDTYEHVSQEMAYWFQREFIPGLSSDILVVIAGRVKPSDLWSDWIARGTVKVIELLNFNSEYTRLYLESLDIRDEDVIEEVFTLTDGHPLSISLSTELGINPQSKFIVSSTLVESIFERITEKKIYSLLEICSIVRFFNVDIVASLTDNDFDTTFDEIRNFSFIRNHEYGLTLHEMVRFHLQEEITRLNYNLFRELHSKALAYFQNELESERAKGNMDYFHQSILEMIYHQIILSENDGIALFVATFLEMDYLTNKRFLYKMLQDAEFYSLKENFNKGWLDFCRGQLTRSEGKFAESIEIFNKVADVPQTNENLPLLLYTYNRFSRVLCESNKLDLAIVYAKRALNLSKQLNDHSEKAMAIYALTNALQHKGKSAEALEYLDEDAIATIADVNQRGGTFLVA